MSLENTGVIDAIGTDIRDGSVVMSIIDGYDWNDESAHLLALQDKLNSYFAFVESGQVFEEYPRAEGRNIRVDIVCKSPYPPSGLAFLDKAMTVAKELDIVITHRVMTF